MNMRAGGGWNSGSKSLECGKAKIVAGSSVPDKNWTSSVVAYALAFAVRSEM